MSERTYITCLITLLVFGCLAVAFEAVSSIVKFLAYFKFVCQ